MEALQLFTAVLLAVCVIHLVFSTVSVCDRWLAKHRRASGAAPRTSVKISPSGWYVFFDPADLYGRPREPRGTVVPSKNQSDKERPAPRKGNERRTTARPSA